MKRPFDQIVLLDYITNYYISTTTVFMATKLGIVVK